MGFRDLYTCGMRGMSKMYNNEIGVCYLPSGLSEVLLQLFRHGSVNVLIASGVARYPVEKIHLVKKCIDS